MTRYLTRKYTALLNLQESQSGSTVSGSKVAAKTKDVADKMSKKKADTKLGSKNSIIRTRSASIRKKANVSVTPSKGTIGKETEKIVTRKRLPKEGVNNRIKSKAGLTCNGFSDLNENKLKSTRGRRPRNEKSKTTTNLRQISLKESFVNLKANVSVTPSKGTIGKETEKIVTRKRLPKEGVNNRIKSKAGLTCNGFSDLNENKLKSTRGRRPRNEKSKTTTNLRQISLKESFVNLVRINTLDYRNSAKNLKNDLKSTKDSPKLKKSSNKEKLPVYKSVPLESSKENTNEIYEFKFDANDSKEKLPKKRKKMAITKKILFNKRKRNILRKQNVQETEVRKKVPAKVQFEEVKEVKEANPQPKEQTKETNLRSEEVKEEKRTKNYKETEKDSVESSEEKVSMEFPIESESKKEDRKEIDIHQSESQDSNKVNANNAKPTIVSVEQLRNKKCTLMDNLNASNSDNFQPFRPTNVFKNELAVQQRNMINHSLFEKSLSPITKTAENLELNSPWRAPQLLTFPQIKNAFHSTPQNRKYDIANNKLVRNLNSERKSYGSTPNLRNILQKNDENMSGEGHVNTVSVKKKNPSVSRRFGTEITNINQSLQSNQSENINETITNEIENVQPNNTVNLSMYNSFNSDPAENKENNTSNHQSQAVPKKEKKIKSQSPKKKTLNMQTNEDTENIDPQPGPSGLQKCIGSNDQRVLRQSNLNNFLNIAEMPQSTEIKTPHRIFEDTYSTPVNSTKSIRRLKEPDIELKNAFGFAEDSNEDVECKSTEDKGKQEKAVQTNLEDYQRPVARLSIGEIKNKLLVKKLKDDIKKEQNVKTELRADTKKSPLKERNRNKIDIATFSDTFDILSEIGESSVENMSDVPLFADLEPTHFAEPPRYSYKRKRPVTYSLSEESEDEQKREEIAVYAAKRKKGNRMKPEQKKRLMDWIDNINKTFSEVDEHELVIE